MNVHFIGIGGVGMAGLAVLLKAQGCGVTGCDVQASARTAWLESLGIPVAVGHDPTHLSGVDEVIVTPAVHADNPEFVQARCQCRVRYRGDVLAECVSAASDAIAVCGSHGKTTTATWIAKLLIALGEDVAWAIGGETGDFPVAGRAKDVSPGRSAVLVVEADESDGTLAQYHATTLVVTNCEYDHPDHFKTRADYIACYDAARRNAKNVIESESLDSIFALSHYRLAPHNLRNARAAVEVALRRGHDLASILKVLPDIVATLPDRRFQKIAEGVYTDYAHHPTEMRCAVQMARACCAGVLRVIFQPHRYSRTKALLKDFPAAFAGADEVVLCPTYAAFEAPIPGGDVADLHRECCAQAQESRPVFSLATSCAAAWEKVHAEMRAGDLALLLGAGDIIALAPKIAAS